MWNVIKWTLKTTILSVFVLVLGNWIRWEGVTLSDQVRLKMDSIGQNFESGVDSMKGMATGIGQKLGSGGKVDDIRRSISRPLSQSRAEDLTLDERQRLRALLRDVDRLESRREGSK